MIEFSKETPERQFFGRPWRSSIHSSTAGANPIMTALERVPRSYLEASADLGAKPATTFRRVVWPLSIPGIAAGSIFTFSLTLGDYIIPTVIGDSSPFIGLAIYSQQGVAGNLPLAAAFSFVPIAVMAIYLTIARRLGAFEAI